MSSTGTKCTVCHKGFGLFRREDYCRKCGRFACKSCCGKLEDFKGPVCNPCIHKSKAVGNVSKSEGVASVPLTSYAPHGSNEIVKEEFPKRFWNMPGAASVVGIAELNTESSQTTAALSASGSRFVNAPPQRNVLQPGAGRPHIILSEKELSAELPKGFWKMQMAKAVVPGEANPAMNIDLQHQNAGPTKDETSAREDSTNHHPKKSSSGSRYMNETHASIVKCDGLPDLLIAPDHPVPLPASTNDDDAELTFSALQARLKKLKHNSSDANLTDLEINERLSKLKKEDETHMTESELAEHFEDLTGRRPITHPKANDSSDRGRAMVRQPKEFDSQIHTSVDELIASTNEEIAIDGSWNGSPANPLAKDSTPTTVICNDSSVDALLVSVGAALEINIHNPIDNKKNHDNYTEKDDSLPKSCTQVNEILKVSSVELAEAEKLINSDLTKTEENAGDNHDIIDQKTFKPSTDNISAKDCIESNAQEVIENAEVLIKKLGIEMDINLSYSDGENCSIACDSDEEESKLIAQQILEEVKIEDQITRESKENKEGNADL